MARWRARAIECLPHLRTVIAPAADPMALWIDLRSAFERAYEADPRDEATIAGVYAFADWCATAPGRPDAEHDPLTAVVVAFYEHVPGHPAARDDMPRWFRPDELRSNRDIFAHQIGGRAFADVLAHVVKHADRYRPREREAAEPLSATNVRR